MTTEAAIKERSIILTGQEIKNIQNGTTRLIRAITLREFQPTTTPGYDWIFRDERSLWNDFTTKRLIEKYCRYGKPGEILWVKESYIIKHPYALPGDDFGPCYRVDYDVPELNRNGILQAFGWHSPVHMPRNLARLILQITDIEIENISGQWAWVIEFKRVKNDGN